MKAYDMAFGLGFSCGASTSLRLAGLQHESYPLDWIGSPGLLQSAQTVAGDFERWFEREDLRLYDIRRGGLNKHVYRNERTGFGFPHDFSSFVSFDEQYRPLREKYDRRIARFLEKAGKARRLLAVYVEYPVRDREPTPVLEKARQTLAARFPDAEVDLLYVYEGVGVEHPSVDEVEPGLLAVQVEYRELERGQVMHTVDHSRIVRYLKESVSVPDDRTDEEKRAYARVRSERREAKWGKGGALDTLLNKWAYRLYRKLEKRLVDKGIVPWEGPLWFVRVDK